MGPRQYALAIVPMLACVAIGMCGYAVIQIAKGNEATFLDASCMIVPGAFIGAIIGGRMVLSSLEKKRAAKFTKTSDEVLAEIRQSAAAQASVAAQPVATTTSVRPATPPTAATADAPPPAVPPTEKAAPRKETPPKLSELIEKLDSEKNVAAAAGRTGDLIDECVDSDDGDEAARELEAELEAIRRIGKEEAPPAREEKAEAGAPSAVEFGEEELSEEKELEEELNAALRASEEK